MYQCDLCTRKFSRKSDLAQHYNFLHPLKQLHTQHYSITSSRKVLHELGNDIWKDFEDLDDLLNENTKTQDNEVCIN